MATWSEWIGRIRSWLDTATAQIESGALAWQLGSLAVFSLLAFLASRIVRVLVDRGVRRVEGWRGTRIRALRFQRQEIISEEQTTGIVAGLLRGLGYAGQAVVLWAFLLSAFRLFPGTRGFAQELLDYVLAALEQIATAVIDYLPNLVFLAVLYLIGTYTIRLAKLIFDGVEIGRIRILGFHPDFAPLTFKIVRFLIAVFIVIVALPYLPGSDSPALQGVSIFLGVLLSLGSSGAVANVISGIVLTYMRAFQLGDRVKIADAVGDVVEKTMFVTRVRTVKHVDITIPNAMVLANHIVNFSAQARTTGVLLHTTVTIGYDVPWQRAEELLIQAARATEHIEADPAPFVLQTSLDDFYVHYELNVCTRAPDQMSRIYSDLHRAIQDHLHAAGVELASPHLAAIRDGNRAQIPEDYLPTDYEPPSFRLLPLPVGFTSGSRQG